MAFQRIDSITWYIGASTDTKPDTGVDIGSLLLETDTSIWWMWDGSTWSQYDINMR